MNTKKTKKIVILDYKLSNLFSVFQACQIAGFEPQITSDKNEINKADALILPGVGAFADAMKNLQQLDLISPLKDFANSGKPLLGVCLGLQLLFEESEEFGSTRGLGLIEGSVKKIPAIDGDRKIRVPHMGWNQIYQNEMNWSGTILQSVKQKAFMYFVHSLFVEPKDKSIALSLTNYENLEFCSSIKKMNIMATQFHPEKSGKEGLLIYEQWKNIVFSNE